MRLTVEGASDSTRSDGLAGQETQIVARSKLPKGDVQAIEDDETGQIVPQTAECTG